MLNSSIRILFFWLLIGISGGFMLCAYAQEDEIILITDPKITSIPIINNQEPMIDLRDQKEIIYGPSPEIPNNTDYTKLRKTVYEKLKQAQMLLPKNLRFCLYEGYRSLNLQKTLFDNRYLKVQKQHPDWPQDKIFKETTKLVAPTILQDGSKNVPPHSTGGAIDIYLINDKGIPVDMGIHPKDWMNDNDGSVSLSSSRKISLEAQKNRKIMQKVLLAVGFTNCPTEYWHWSYGDQYWAYHHGKPHAIYGSWVLEKVIDKSEPAPDFPQSHLTPIPRDLL